MNDSSNRNFKQMDPAHATGTAATDAPSSDTLDDLYARWQADRHQERPLALKEWAAVYPSCTSELIEWTSIAPLMEGFEESAVPAEDRIQVEKIMDRTLARKMQAWSANPSQTAPRDLYTLAKEKGLKPRDLAVTLGVGLDTVAKLQSRLIHFATIPTLFLHTLADTLHTSIELTQAMLDQPPVLAQGALYKSDGVPEVGRTEAFDAVIQASRTMTDAQKQRWLKSGR